MRALDTTTVARGVAIGLLLAAPALAVSLVVDTGGPDDPTPTWALAAYLLVMAGSFALAGLMAGHRRPDTPMRHGAAAAGAVFLVIELVSLPRVIAGGAGVTWGAVVVLGLLAVTEGVAAGLLAEWYRRRRRRRTGRTLGSLGESAG